MQAQSLLSTYAGKALPFSTESSPAFASSLPSNPAESSAKLAPSHTRKNTASSNLIANSSSSSLNLLQSVLAHKLARAECPKQNYHEYFALACYYSIPMPATHILPACNKIARSLTNQHVCTQKYHFERCTIPNRSSQLTILVMQMHARTSIRSHARKTPDLQHRIISTSRQQLSILTESELCDRRSMCLADLRRIQVNHFPKSQVHTRTPRHTCSHTCTYTCTQKRSHAHRSTNTHTQEQRQRYTHIHARTNTCTHKRARTQAHTPRTPIARLERHASSFHTRRQPLFHLL